MMPINTDNNPKCYEVTMRVYAHAACTADDVKSLIRDLEWCGGHLSPEDPRFYCLDVVGLRLKRVTALDRKLR